MIEPVEVCAAVILHGGRLLLATRPKGKHLEGCWEFPGGKVMDGETLAACIIRELFEELGLHVRQASLLFDVLHSYPEKTIRLHFLLCDIDPEQAIYHHDGQRSAWFQADQLPLKMMAAADRMTVDKIRQGKWMKPEEHSDQSEDGLPIVRNLELTAFLQDWLTMKAKSESSCGAVPRRLEHPEWYKVPFSGGRERIAMRNLLRGSNLHTVCESARCPNLCDCWKRQTATFMILGDTCTRNCRFCAVRHGSPQTVDAGEPGRIAEGIAKLNLRFAVITCVTRDDLPDGGAGLMAETIRAIHQRCPETGVEVLCSDYAGNEAALQSVLEAGPEVFGHNLETVERLTPMIRNKANYRRSLEVLSRASAWAARHGGRPRIKSGLMLGLGESEQEIRQALADLRQAEVEIVTIGQYLQPGKEQCPVVRHVSPEEFKSWEQIAEQEFAFKKAVCGPLIRSSYLAEEAYRA